MLVSTELPDTADGDMCVAGTHVWAQTRGVRHMYGLRHVCGLGRVGGQDTCACQDMYVG